MKQFWAVTTFSEKDPVWVTQARHHTAKQATREILPESNGSGVWVKPLGQRVPPREEVEAIDGWRPLLKVVY